MSFSVTVTRTGGGAVAVTRTEGATKVVEANNISTLVAAALGAVTDTAADAAAAAASASSASSSAGAAASSEANAAASALAADASADAAAISETNAAASASSASTSAGTATTQAGIATTQAGTATTQAGIATTQATSAEASAVAAAASAASITLPLPIGSGGTGQTTAPLARTALGAAASGANTDITSAYLDNTGLKIKDSDASHGLSIVPGSNLTADRTLTILTGDASRTLAINASSTVAGTNTGDQTITLTSDVTGTGTGSFATTIAANAVTDTKLRDSAALSVIGRSANSSGDPGDITFGSDGHVLRRSGTAVAAGTLAAGAFATGPGIVTPAMLDNGTALSVLGRTANTGGARADIAATNDGEVMRRSGTAIGFGTVATAGIADDAVTNAKLANMAANTIKGRITGSTGDPEDLTAADVRTIIGVGSAVQAWDATLDSVSGLSLASGDILYATGADTLARLAKGSDGQFLKLASGLPSWAAGGGAPTLQVLTASGTYTPTAGATKALVYVVGGGGGGGGGDSDGATHSGAGGGGGGGGCSAKLITLSGTYSFTIGAAGTAGSATGGTAGGAGGTTTFGTGPLLQATGGAGGSGSGVSASASAVVAGGASGVGSLGDFNFQGGAGGNAIWAEVGSVMAGAGGSSFFGGGGTGAIRSSAGQTSGGAAGSYGGGGGGGACDAQTTGAAGGLGGIGVIFVLEFP